MMTELREWAVQGMHEMTSNVDVHVVDRVPVAGRLDEQLAVAIEVPFASRAFLLPEQARHLASVLVQAAEFAEHPDAT